MHPKSHARLMSILNWAIPIGGYPFLCAWFLGWMTGERSFLPLLLLGITLALLSQIAWSLPVRCSSPGCHGWMKKTGTWAIDWKSKLEYQCAICKGIFETEVYHPPFRLY